jgi:hypothetical protein
MSSGILLRFAAFGCGLAPLLAGLSGCQTYTAQTDLQSKAVRRGALEEAVAHANENAEKHKDDKDTVIHRLEQAAVLRQAGLARMVPPGPPPVPAPTPAPAAGEADAPGLDPRLHRAYFTQSLAALDAAEQRLNKHQEEAKVKVLDEAFAFVTNQANLPYRGRIYDAVMLNTYKALNHLHLGDPDAARIELNRAMQRQADAVAANAARIEAAMEAQRAAKEGKIKSEKGDSKSYDVDKALKDPRSKPALDAVERELVANIKPYGDYVNPFTVLLDGLFAFGSAELASDLERARKSMERFAGLVPDNPYVKDDLAAAEAFAEGRTPEGITYVLFETGAAPVRQQLTLPIPVFLFTNKADYTHVALPKLAFQPDYVSSLKVVVGEQEFPSAPVCSMDSVVANDFKNEWPAVLSKAIITAGTNTVLQSVARKGAEKVVEATGNVAAQAGAMLNQFGAMFTGGAPAPAVAVTPRAAAAAVAAINIADLRTWRSLPKQFHYLRFPTPENRRVALVVGPRRHEVEVLPGSLNVIYVKSASPTAPTLIDQFVLRPEPQ